MKKFLTLLGSLLIMVGINTTAQAHQHQETAIFAGGCFWCLQEAFDKVPGVISTTVGYTGGKSENPSYEQVSSGGSGHVEALKVTFNPKQVDYSSLLKTFWRNVDPTDGSGQFCDRGNQYRSVIFYGNLQQKEQATKSKEVLEQSGKVGEVQTEIIPASPFYLAESYHQKYYQKNPVRYKFYKFNCGRMQRLKKIWS